MEEENQPYWFSIVAQPVFSSPSDERERETIREKKKLRIKTTHLETMSFHINFFHTFYMKQQFK